MVYMYKLVANRVYLHNYLMSSLICHSQCPEHFFQSSICYYTDLLVYRYDLSVPQVNPLFDPSGATANMAANLLFEMLCVLPGVDYIELV